MEVHAHSHTPIKKWTHYLWEFLMLFLAVFCGFLAENQRDHMVEHTREEKFAKRLLSDLREDTTFLGKRIGRLEDRKKKYGDFLSVMTGPQKPSSLDVMKPFFLLLKSYPSEFITTTYNQMKTSGALRYINNDALVSSLQKYYEVVIPKASVDAEGADKIFTDYVVPYMIKHFRFQKLMDSTTVITKPESEMFNRTAESDQELINIMGVYQGACNGLLDRQKPALERCKELIELIQKDYHLK
jgi:hypothetical protein